MGYVIEKEWYIIIQRHIMFVLIKYIKDLFFIILWLSIFYFSYLNLVSFKESEFNIISFVVIILLLHYAFIKIILYTVIYYYNLIIVFEDEFTIIKSSLILEVDIEVIDIYKIMKIDSYIRWLFPNIFWYWSIIIEQQKNDVREFHYISKPYSLLKLLKKQRNEFEAKK